MSTSIAGLVSISRSEGAARTCEQVDEELDAAAGHEGDPIGARGRERGRIVAADGGIGDHQAVQQPQQCLPQRPPWGVVQEGGHVSNTAERSCAVAEDALETVAASLSRRLLAEARFTNTAAAGRLC